MGVEVDGDNEAEARREFELLYNSDDPWLWVDHTLENKILELEIMEVPDE